MRIKKMFNFDLNNNIDFTTFDHNWGIKKPVKFQYNFIFIHLRLFLTITAILIRYVVRCWCYSTKMYVGCNDGKCQDILIGFEYAKSGSTRLNVGWENCPEWQSITSSLSEIYLTSSVVFILTFSWQHL